MGVLGRLGADADTARARAGCGTLAAGQQSDHLVMAAAVAGWEAARAQARPPGAAPRAPCVPAPRCSPSLRAPGLLAKFPLRFAEGRRGAGHSMYHVRRL
jgi:hypothetical protein